MSRITKWKLEKSKVKVVFRLQFHATHIPQPGWDKLFISLIPDDSGKATAKTTKANVRSGACKWGDPIYETTRLLQDTKTKQYDDKFYKLLVAMGSSRSSVLGEVIINLAHFADALKPSAIALPLEGCDSGAVLHVTIQLLTSKTGFREFEQQRELRERGLQSTSDESTARRISSSDDIINDPMDKGNTRVRFKEELPPLEEVSVNEESDSAVGFDGSSTTSEGLYTEKQDTTSNTHEVDSLKSAGSVDFGGPSFNRLLPGGSNDWSSDISADNDVANVYEENSRLRRSLEMAETSITELKIEVNTLKTHADELGHEAQSFAHLLSTELASGETLAREISALRLECSNFKSDLERLKKTKPSTSFNNRASLYNADQMLPGSRFGSEFYLSPLVPQEIDSAERDNDVKGFSLVKEVDDLKAERESLTRKMDQMECYYEALVQELEETQRRMIGELQSLRTEHSTCIYTISASKAEMENVHQDMNKQIMRFSEEKCSLDSLNKDLERRAVTAEAALKRARLNYSIAVGQLQKDLELLSVQILSMHETNENLIKQAFSDSSPSSVLVYDEAPENHRCQNYFGGIKKKHLEGEIVSEELKRSLLLQKGLYRKVEEEVDDVHLMNLYLDIFSKTLQETLLEASADFGMLKQRVNELNRTLEISTESKEILMQRLQSAMNEVLRVNGYKDECDVKCNDLTHQNQVLETKFRNISKENFALSEKIAECEIVMKQMGSYESKFQSCSMEKLELENLLKKETLENGNLRVKISVLQEEMKAYRTEFDELASEKENLRNQLEELEQSNFKNMSQLNEEKQGLLKSLNAAELDNLVTKRKFGDEMRGIMDKFTASSITIQRLRSEVEDIASRLKISSEAEETHFQKNQELLNAFDHLANELHQITSKNEDLGQEIKALEIATRSLSEEREVLKLAARDKDVQSTRLEEELHSLRSSLKVLHGDLDVERRTASKLESEVSDLTSRLLNSDEQINELIRTRQLVKELELEKSSVLNAAREECSSISSLESHISEMHEISIASDVKHTFTQTQYDTCVEEIHKKCLSLEIQLSASLATEKHYNDENAKLTESLNLLTSELETSIARNRSMSIELDESKKSAENTRRHDREIERLENTLMEYEEENDSLMLVKGELEVKLLVLQFELDSSVVQNGLLFDANNQLRIELDETKKRAESLESTSHVHAKKYEAEIDNLMLVKEELEVKLLVIHLELDSSVSQNGILLDENTDLRTKLEKVKTIEGASHVNTEQTAAELEGLKGMLVKSEEEIDSLMLAKEELEVKLLVLEAKLIEHEKETLTLQKKHDETSQRLAEQVFKTEEFRNISTRLKELNEKRPETPSPAAQESLRIVFIKEQYETKLQELKQQLSVSKKHGEELLWKLQDAIDELEKLKRTEASNVKRNEELGMRILELETDLHAAISEKRETMNAYDLMKAEKECSSISLDCCKEEKQELEELLKKCNEEKSKIALELSLMKDFVESSKKDEGTCESTNSSSRGLQLGQEDARNGETDDLALVNDHFKGNILRSSMEHLNQELEKMKYESLLFSEEDNQIDPNFPGLQRELMHLNKVNEELEGRFPSFKQFPGNGNAIERVLALEIELAEALQEKKNSVLHFQSSFLKQHSDEEAIFKSFRDINDLIKDMLEIKGRYTSVETELKEMHGRYSQLSLQFAEVEGERQKLMMTLKNVRSPKKLPYLHRSSTAPLGSSLP